MHLPGCRHAVWPLLQSRERRMNALGLGPLFRLWALAWYRWALREIHPLHRDVPFIVRRINELEQA